MIRTTTSTGATAFEFTTQLFFDQTVIDAIFATVPPYSSRGVPDTTNGADNIYDSATQLTLQTASGRIHRSDDGGRADVSPGILNAPVRCFCQCR
jgi:hypothetical protein